MANTVAFTKGTKFALWGTFTGDGTVAGPTVANATILAALPDGPLKDIFSTARSNQAAMRTALFAGGANVVWTMLYQSTGVDVTAESNLFVVDADTDAVTATLPELNFAGSDTTGQVVHFCARFLPPDRM